MFYYIIKQNIFTQSCRNIFFFEEYLYNNRKRENHMNDNSLSGAEINLAAVLLAQILASDLAPSEMNLLASFLYTVSDCLNTIAMTANPD